MATKSVELELVELEKRLWRALQDHDASTAIALTDFPVLLTGPQGVATVDRPRFEEMMSDARYSIERAELGDLQVHLLRPDIAVVAYRVHERVTVEGQMVSFDAAESSAWIRRNGHWACAVHAEAIVGDPFGRDAAS